MTTIYLTGAISTEGDNPFAWHEDIMNDERYAEQEFINPYDLNDFDLGDAGIYERPSEVVEPSLAAIEDIDGMLVRWDDDAFLIGTTMEILYARMQDVPVVIWYDGWKDNLSPWLLYTTRARFDDRDRALEVLITFAGDATFL
jgi:hypothetical protein